MSFKDRLKTARKAVQPKLTQAAMAEALGVTPQAISGWERGEAMPEPEKLPDIAVLLQMDVSALLGQARLKPTSLSQHGEPLVNHPKKISDGGLNRTLRTVPTDLLMGELDLPVYSYVQGGQGALVLENEPFNHIARPKRLIGKRRGYGVQVIGDSCAREYNEGDIAYVDPELPPRKDDPCVFQGTREDGTVEAMIKYLERSPDASDTVYYVSQTNPPKKFTIKKADWQICHVAVGKESGR